MAQLRGNDSEGKGYEIEGATNFCCANHFTISNSLAVIGFGNPNVKKKQFHVSNNSKREIKKQKQNGLGPHFGTLTNRQTAGNRK